VLCGKTNAERVKADLGSGKAESIGKKLAESCRTYSEQAESPWYCEQLKQNQNELNRLVKIVRPWLVGV
jgi:ubiquinone biosynthesis protein UbiJ